MSYLHRPIFPSISCPNFNINSIPFHTQKHSFLEDKLYGQPAFLMGTPQLLPFTSKMVLKPQAWVAPPPGHVWHSHDTPPCLENGTQMAGVIPLRK